ncbi:hypothetical protein [Photobacterium halotolerans]|uniref:hypothetical protein n=1 Tax=Photobacterium halotolerans TaxID=265726 RepID=UPI0003FF6C4D|nr:hypothetical protein [Photobacterium halotolerans]
MTPLERAVKRYGTHSAVTEALERETGYKFAPQTIGRILRHECKESTAAFVQYALRNILDREQAA